MISAFLQGNGGTSIDVKAIAVKIGIMEIKVVPPEDIHGEHAILDGTVIKLNQDDDPEEQNFSIAHEMFHFVSRGDNGKNMPIVARQRDIWIKELLKDYQVPVVPKGGYNAAMPIVARSVAKLVAPSVALYVALSALTQAEMWEKQKNAIDYSLLAQFVNEQVIYVVEEEIADYFAANLLVPVERFISWEGKPDEEIARAFKVNIGCIRKRREEVRHEVIYIVSQQPEASHYGSVPVDNKHFIGIGEMAFKTKNGSNTPSLRFMVDRTASGNFEATLLEFGLVSWSEEEKGAIESLVKQTRLYIHTVIDKGGFDTLSQNIDDHVMGDYRRCYWEIASSLCNTKNSSNEAETRLVQGIKDRIIVENTVDDGKIFSVTPSVLSYYQNKV
jgi:hypothetical protein